MRVAFTQGARIDLSEIASFIGEGGSPRRGLSFVRELRAACLGLANQPERFPVILQRRRMTMRRAIHGNYSIFYSADANEVRIVRILHSARDFEKIIFPEN